MLSKGEAAALLSLINAHHGNAQWDDVQLDAFYSELRSDIVLLQCLFDRFGSVFPQCGLMVFPGVVIVSR